MANDKFVKTAINRTNAMEYRHTRLEDGRHSDVSIELTRLINYPIHLSVVMNKTVNIAEKIKPDAVIPTTKSALKLASYLPSSLSVIDIENEGESQLPAELRDIIKNIGRVIIFRDVIMTSNSSVQYARTLREINPSIELHHFGIWDGAGLHPSLDSLFTSQHSLVEERIDAWPAEECFFCPDDL